MKGKIHSVETCGTVDGPGIRFVVFMQGCPLRCQYCHNPDTWHLKDGKEIDVEELIIRIKKVRPYMKFSGGGVTISGGEATMQKKFVIELLKRCKEEGIHTAIDTSGFISLDDAKEILTYTDLVLLDIKHISAQKHKQLTGVTNELTLQLAKYLHHHKIPFWIRYVLVPGLTDDIEDLYALRAFINTIPSVEKIEVLPYHTMGKYKWLELGLEEPLKGVKPPTDKQIKLAEDILIADH
ncbi:pyruvate formate-lyase 1-activating enzyme [Vulcanibacillus modesticaldus]|uniref:Pyruvate formate-lyase-activating enzyme n=1 Tax=Vulcanibacillus modesticaldus TaxID=337097 RepID=A0A1D2YTR2_9BACI|nr:pyruvate formate-lyase-activating protein [Vulcanibacillus modesticaldus]OEF99066.1 pyruvate formate-lyase 1-activating enzyme [Vulcanibacillus modesticaldus]